MNNTKSETKRKERKYFLTDDSVNDRNDTFTITEDTETGYIYLDPKGGPHEFTFIFLHGQGELASNYTDMFTCNILKNLLGMNKCRIVLPRASIRDIGFRKDVGAHLQYRWFETKNTENDLFLNETKIVERFN